MARRHDPVRQQAQGPASHALGRVAASERDQMRLAVARDLGLLAGVGPVIEGSLQSLRPEAMKQLADRDIVEASRRTRARVRVRAPLVLERVSCVRCAPCSLDKVVITRLLMSAVYRKRMD